MAGKVTYDIGFLGGGQLARMSIQAAQRMGLRCLSLDPGSVTPASQVADAVRGELADTGAIRILADRCERITLENEFIPAEAIAQALRGSGRSEDVIVPGLHTLATIQDKLKQRMALADHGVPSPHARGIDPGAASGLREFPVVLKARFGGYDGKGTRYAHSRGVFDSFHELWAAGGWLVEEFVPFRRELAVMVAISDQETIAFPTMETVQRDHVCDLVFPAGVEATQIAVDAVESVGGRGLFGVELFETMDGQLLVNEIAPRPHNTGHYTLDWGGPSQFEAHVRAVMGFTQVEPRSESFAVMANLLGQAGAGDHRQATAAALESPGVFVHWYGKVESRPGRKMVHLNVVSALAGAVEPVVARAQEARDRFYGAWSGT